jgi:plastocyanin domain-containing protein
MNAGNIITLIAGLAAIAGIVWYFWGPRRSGTRAGLASSGYQEALVLVKGGYTPDVIIVQHGKPVRLTFRREETASCSEMVVFDAFGKSAHLPTGEAIPVEFVPTQAGEYDFGCQMGMFRGKLIVE